MPKTYTLDKEKRIEIVLARKENHDKQVGKRLFAVQQRMEGKQNREIAERLETSSDVVSRWVSMYANGGIETLLAKKRQEHHRNMSYEEEVNFLVFFGLLYPKDRLMATFFDRLNVNVNSGIRLNCNL